jgi:hypothetical protein
MIRVPRKSDKGSSEPPLRDKLSHCLSEAVSRKHKAKNIRQKRNEATAYPEKGIEGGRLRNIGLKTQDDTNPYTLQAQNVPEIKQEGRASQKKFPEI